MANFWGIIWGKIMYVHMYDVSLEGGITIWEGPIAYLMFGQFLSANVCPLHVFYYWNLCGWLTQYVWTDFPEFLRQISPIQ